LRLVSVEDNPNLEARQSQRIERVEIENFRGIQRLSFELGIGQGGQAGWTMLLGENGVGKSSILQALAIALMGEQRVQAMGGDAKPSDLLRRGASSGSIRVFFAADAEPLTVQLTAEHIKFGQTAKRPRLIVLGFGSSRWLPRPGGLDPDRDDFVRIRNLFNPFVPLTDTLGWLTALKADDFARTTDALHHILRLDTDERLIRRNGEILVREVGGRSRSGIPLRQFSDGYQSVVAMVGDIMELLSPKRLDMSVAEGIVLVDELEAHLHPRWKMQVVSRLRTAFPGLQFVTTTHDPLCLRGLYDDEVLLLLRNSRREVVGVSELPSVEALRVDQLLTSPYFGMLSTRDPDVDARFDEYYQLLALRRLTRRQRERLEQIRTQLDIGGLLGADRREQLMLEAIDKYLAREADALADNTDERLSTELAERLATILDGSWAAE
jgi:predicted ATPase